MPKTDSKAILRRIDPAWRRCFACKKDIHDPGNQKPVIMKPTDREQQAHWQSQCRICKCEVSIRLNKKTGKYDVLRYKDGKLEKDSYGQ